MVKFGTKFVILNLQKYKKNTLSTKKKTNLRRFLNS